MNMAMFYLAALGYNKQLIFLSFAPFSPYKPFINCTD